MRVQVFTFLFSNHITIQAHSLDSARPVVHPDVRPVHADVFYRLEVRLHFIFAILVMVHALLQIALLHALAEQLIMFGEGSD